ncbi:GNAT family protein [Aeromicrobium sp.]|uniref:GNAT family N-acetyltransferase n=1 Tax=Aeromicrobium sp. TaxID=1871063 RepID=UPI0019BC24BE|nr:GNAT family protein [Aeromicrobium sp.]MBC7632599.1 GNAT family N-acetyltransferase [Aeromicrobium sp.]
MSDEPLPYPDPPLSDGRIGLRRFDEGDVECIRLASSDPDIPKATTVPATFTPAEGLAFIHRQWSRAENGEGVSQVIVEVDSDRAIGLIWVALRPQRHVGGLGYWVVPPERGQGVATAAARLAIPWALVALDLRRLEAWVEPENLASQRVLRSAGLQREGRLRNFLTIEDRSSDALVFAVIAPER